MTLTFDLLVVQDHCKPSNQRHNVGEVCEVLAKLSQGMTNIPSRKWISDGQTEGALRAEFLMNHGYSYVNSQVLKTMLESSLQ